MTHTRAHRIEHGPRAPMRMVLRYQVALVGWLHPLQDRLMSAALESRHLLRTDARGGAHKSLRIITAEYTARPPTDAIDGVAAATASQNAADLQRVGRVVGIKMSESVPQDTITEFRKANVDRIQSLTSEQLSDLESMLADAEDSGWHADELAKRIQERFDVSDSKASFLARDQVLKLNGDLTEYRQTQSGIVSYQWTTSGDERVRPMHAELEGTLQTWADPPETNAAGDTNNPGSDYQCRCTAYPLVDL